MVALCLCLLLNTCLIKIDLLVLGSFSIDLCVLIVALIG